LSKTQFSKSKEYILFLKKLLKNPKNIGALFPSSNRLGNLMAKHVPSKENSLIVEVGGGTGRLSSALLRNGINPDHLYIIELDSTFVEYLKNHLSPKVHILQGDAAQLDAIIPKKICGKVDIIISALPLINMKSETKKKILQSYLKILRPQGIILQFTYGMTSPISEKEIPLEKQRVGYVLQNFPPATIWKYWRKPIS